MRRDMRILKDQRNMATNSQDDIELRRALRTTKSYNYEATTNDQHTEKHQRISRQKVQWRSKLTPWRPWPSSVLFRVEISLLSSNNRYSCIYCRDHIAAD